MRLFHFIWVISLISVVSCDVSVTTDHATVAENLKKTEIAFSDLSKEKGMRIAFLKYIDSSGVLLRPGHYPIVGKDAQAYLENTTDTAFTLTWVPSDVFVSKSGELGYTYGLYTYVTKDTSFQGTYVSVWRKNNQGEWKFVVDTGNPGVGTQK